MTYALGAGPGATRTYLVDAPQPWGSNTPITVPVDAIVGDFWASLKPRIDSWANDALNAATQSMTTQVKEAVAAPLNEAVASGSIIVERVAWPALFAAALIGAVTGYAICRVRR